MANNNNNANDENVAVSALTGLSLNHLLEDFGGIQGGSGLTNRLGIVGIPSLDSKQIYNDRFDDDDAVGPELGEDWEAQVDRELMEEGGGDEFLNESAQDVQRGKKEKQKKVKVIKKMVEKPKSVYERFPAFRQDEVLDFSELFKGYTVRKSRLVKRPFHSELFALVCARYGVLNQFRIVETVYPRKREPPKAFLESIVGDTQRQVENKQAEDIVASGSVEQDLRKALEVSCIEHTRYCFPNDC